MRQYRMKGGPKWNLMESVFHRWSEKQDHEKETKEWPERAQKSQK